MSENFGEVEKHSKLTLKIIQSNTIEVGTEIHLNYLGLESNGLKSRKEHTFITRFGCSSQLIEKQDSIADYQFPYDECLQPLHFEIKYDINTRSYYVRNNKHSTVFERIAQKIVLHPVSIIDFGHNQVIIKITKSTNGGPSILNFVVNHGVSKGKELTVSSDETQIVKLGRKFGKDILMEFPDESTSRVQLK